MQDLNNKILLHPEIGIGVKYIDYNKQIEYDTLSKQAMKERIKIETISEEMRILYVALTRAKEKLIITGYSKPEKEDELNDIISKYGETSYLVLKKYISYLDWIRLVYISNKEKMSKLADINIYEKSQILKSKSEKKESSINSTDIKQKLEKELDEKEYKEIAKNIEYKYKNQEATVIPNKTSVTEIKKLKSKNKDNELVTIEIPKPKFLQRDESEKITNAEKGTLIHLCMQKLNIIQREYTVDDIKEFVQKLQKDNIISEKEYEAINIMKIYNFTKSNIWKELKQAKVVEREKPFYINIPAKDVYGKDLDEQLLVQGIIDLYYIDKEDNLILVDYKTDYVENRDEQILINKYKMQLELYKKALESAMNKKVSRVYIYSTYLDRAIILEE